MPNDELSPAAKLAKPRVKYAILILVLVAALLEGSFLVVFTVRDRIATLKGARGEMEQLVDLMAEQVRSAIDTDAVVLSRMEELVRNRGIPALTWNPPAQRLLRQIMADDPAIQSLLILGPDGKLVLSSHDPADGSLDRADRDYFREVLPPALRQDFISPMIRGRMTGRVLFVASRRVDDQSGHFLGVVQSSIDADYFIQIYHRLARNPAQTFAIFKADGTIVLRYPLPAEAEGKAARPEVLSLAERAPAGTYTRPSIFDGVERLFAYRTIPDRRLVVTTGMPLDSIMNGWRTRTLRNSAMTAGSLAVLLALAWWAWRVAERAEEDRRAAEQKAQRLDRIVAMMSEGNKALVQADDEQTLCQAMCDLVVDYGGYRMAWMGVAEHDEGRTLRPIAHAGREDGFFATAMISWADGPSGAGPSGTAVRTGQPQVNNDFETNPLVDPWRQAALERGYRSGISLPLKERARVFGVLTLYAPEPNAFGPEEVKLLVSLADDVSYGITALRTRHDHDRLERALFHLQKMESLGQLTGGVAHDFNNLLQVILSNLDSSLKAVGSSATVASYLQNAIAGAEQGAKLTSHLLAFARRQPLRPEPLRLDRLVGDMANLLRRTIGETIDIELVTSSELWTALADPNQLQNAILNLAINARDAMPEGGRLTIELANASVESASVSANPGLKAGQYVVVAITDTGMGMPAAIVEKVFEPFFTTKPEGKGTGLGLSMVYGFVKQSGGHIKIESELGRGTTIRIYLPQSDEPDSPPAVEQTTAVPGDGETILVAEDNDGVRASAVSQLTELGYRVKAVADGEAALAILGGSDKIDLLFTDVVMPGRLNGRALADKAQELRPGLAIVFTSGYTQDAILHQGRLDEGVTLLSKPYRLAQLAETVCKALGKTPRLPSETVDGREEGAVQAGPTAGGESPAEGLVLLVEDEELVRSALVVSLELAGYRVLSTGEPSEALRQLADCPDIRLLISDFSLPEKNGLALAREALAAHPHLAVIIATGHQLDRNDLPDPSIQVLIKPFRPDDIRAAIETALRGRHGGKSIKPLLSPAL